MGQITTFEVARQLGVSQTTVQTWCRLGILPRQVSGSIDRQTFEDWLNSRGGQRVQEFIDTSHRSQMSEQELDEWLLNENID